MCGISMVAARHAATLDADAVTTPDESMIAEEYRECDPRECAAPQSSRRDSRQDAIEKREGELGTRLSASCGLAIFNFCFNVSYYKISGFITSILVSG
jgi:hypothetical protein